MKIKNIILLTILVVGQNWCFGQVDQNKRELEKIQTNSTQDSPFYILKVDNKSLEFDSNKNQKFDLKTVDQNSIESVSVLKGSDATDKYGDKGQNGVIVITFRDFKLLSKELQLKFNDSDKN